MEPIKFEDYKGRIIQALTDKGFSFYNENTNSGDYLILDNFINQPIQKEMSGNLVIGGPTLPMVAIVNRISGEVKFIALKLIIPDFPLN